MNIEKKKVAELVVDDFEEKIKRGELKKGDKLPNENEYARQLGISRLSLREAIQLLRSMGAIVQKPKVGTIIICDNPDLWVRMPSADEVMTSDALQQLMDTRLLIESYVTRLYAQNATVENLKNLRKNVTEQIALSGELDSYEAYERYTDNDMNFHMMIAIGSGNAYLARIFSSVLQNIREFAITTFVHYNGTVVSANKMHLQICEALEARDGKLAAKLMEKHIKMATQHSLKQ